MITRLIQKMKLHRYKTIIFVDTENVGYLLPESIPTDIFIYLFVSDSYIMKKLECYRFFKNIQIVDISSIKNQFCSKNIMDFCIVTKLSDIVSQVKFHQKIMICSKDKGYDSAISFLKKDYPSINIQRYSGILNACCHDNKELLSVIQKMSYQTLNKFHVYSNMTTLKKNISKKQKKIFIIKEYINPISQIKISIEFDVYKLFYCIFKADQKIYTAYDKEEANDLFDQCVYQVENQYNQYKTRDLYIKSKQLNICKYIEESYLKKKSLQECLIEHFGEDKGQELYFQYTH